MTLNTVPGIITEQGRIYRLWTNGKIRSGEMTQAVFALREIRHSVESLPPEQSNPMPAHINIVSIDPGTFLNEDQIRDLHNFGPLKLVEHSQKEHIAQIEPPPPHNPEPDREFEPRTERERRLLAELEALSSEQLLERAKAAGFDVDSIQVG